MRGKGYWFDPHSYELIPIVDHLVFLQDIEGKVRNELSPGGSREQRWARDLGLVAGRGWGAIPKEPPAERRERFLKLAMQAGWIRIRRQGPVLVFEYWKETDDTLVALSVAVKLMTLHDGERIELHSVSNDRATDVTVGELKQTVLGESGVLGFSVYNNPIKGTLKIRSNPSREFTAYANPCGNFDHPHCGRFWATHHAYCVGPRFRDLPHVIDNPAMIKPFVEPEKGEGETVAKFFLGLTRGVGARRGEAIEVSEVMQYVKDVRRSQLNGLPGGASFIAQRGFFTDWKRSELHPDEDSVQIMIFPEFEGGEDLKSFPENMRAILTSLQEVFSQRSVIANIVVNGKLDFLGEAVESE